MSFVANKKAVIVPIFAAFVFGLYPAAAQLAYREGANVSFVLLIVTLFRTIALGLYCLVSRKQLFPESKQTKAVVFGGFFQAISSIGIIASLMYLPGPVMIVLIFTHTILLLLFMGWRKEVELTRATVNTTLLALIGVGLVVDVVNNLENIQWLGISLALMASLATVCRLYIYGKEVQEADPAVVGARMFAMAVIFLLPIILFQAPCAPSSMSGFMGVLLCCFSLAIGSFAMFYGIAIAGAFQFSLMVKLEPVFTSLFSWLVLGELLNFSQYLGILLVVSSLIVYQCCSANQQDE